MKSLSEQLEECMQQVVVIDTNSSLIYIGRLTIVGEHILRLEEADVHDLKESKTTREEYLHEAARLGVRQNRKAVFVRTQEVISLSRLEDVSIY